MVNNRMPGFLPATLALVILLLFVPPVAADEYNGNMGKWMHGESNITTQWTYEGHGNVMYSTQPEGAYQGVGWIARTETWSPADLPVPAGAGIEKALLYISYNWDTTPGEIPDVLVTFNGLQIDLPEPYTDQSNIGWYGDYIYGLFVLDVTGHFDDSDDNTLIMTANPGNSQALYPTTLVVVYSDPAEPWRQIFINEECDLIGYSATAITYQTTQAEATAYAPFTGLLIDLDGVKSATLHSFAASAGPDEGNLIWNNAIIETDAWQGTANTASAEVFDVTGFLADTNIAGIQATEGIMVPIQQILVVEYDHPPEDLPLETVQSGTVTGGFFFESENVWGAKPDGADRTVTFDLPEYDSIEWARLYTLVYCGHMEDDRAGRVITSFDGGAGTVELGNELLNIPAPQRGQVYRVADHVNRVTSDYQIWYDVTGEITGTEVTAHVLSQEVDADWDGRIRYIALAVAYTNADGEETTYWFNAGHAVTAPGYNPEPRETVFDTSVLTEQPDDAELTVVYTTWQDATYTFGDTVLPDTGTGGQHFGAKTNSWYITDISDGEPTMLSAERIGSSYKWTLAALVTPAPPPEKSHGVFRPATGEWIFAINEHWTPTPLADRQQFGQAGDIPIFYDGKPGVFRNGQWIFAEDELWTPTPAADRRQFGQAGDIPVVLDGKPGVFRNGQWIFAEDELWTPTPIADRPQFGQAGDIPIFYDGKPGVFRNGQWIFAEDELWTPTPIADRRQFGQAGDIPVVLDGKPGVFRNGQWIFAEDDEWTPTPIADRKQFGQAGDHPVTGISV